MYNSYSDVFTISLNQVYTVDIRNDDSVLKNDWERGTKSEEILMYNNHIRACQKETERLEKVPFRTEGM